jgi:3-oxoacyl-[acyl-carrier-protein] synthase II
MKHRIVVTGLGVVCAIGKTKAEFSAALRAGLSGQKPIRHFDAGAYRTNLAGAVDNVESLMPDEIGLDRCLRFTLHSGRDALIDAGCPHETGDPDRIGVVIASSLGNIDSLQRFIAGDIAGTTLARESIDDVPHSIPAQEISRRYRLGGPVMTVDTACASGTNGIGLACDVIQDGECDIMVAGGVDVLSPVTFSGFNAMMNLSKTRCQPFDKNRSGMMLGEGSAIVILETLESARLRGVRVYGEVYGYGLANDAYHETKPDPEGRGAMSAMRMALTSSGMEPQEIDYVNAHGTGTKLNDVMEIAAIRSVFGDHAGKLAIDSIKGAIGHTLGASGAIEFLSTLISVNEGFIPPTINLETLMDEAEGLNLVPNKALAEAPRVAMSNSFGFSGNCSCIIVGRSRE